ncbi:MAG: hypothetical protein BWK78_07015 [Thiotrichaceae bacterium IS1]|nr:MAG: hypothetical protein BWK78_07015 [Thiotrichaceae bacterium IS1]
MTSTTEQKKFKILSLDGGGVRGYLSAKILANIEDYLNKQDEKNLPIGNRFDLIAGTSTGGIIALGLAIGKTAKEIEQLYVKDIPEIFGNTQLRKGFLRATRPKFKSDILEKKLSGYFGEHTLKDVKVDVLITSINLDDAKPRIHKSDYFSRNTGRIDEKLRDIAVATSSAPTYFSAKEKLVHSHNLIDGGLCANNPSMLALTDALLFERDSKIGTPAPQNQLTNMVMLSIGTGERGQMPYNSNKLKNGGWFNWAKPIIEILMESQSQIAHFQALSLLKEQYLRINPKLNFKMALDDASQLDRLKNLADVDLNMENFLTKFFLGDNSNV